MIMIKLKDLSIMKGLFLYLIQFKLHISSVLTTNLKQRTCNLT